MGDGRFQAIARSKDGEGALKKWLSAVHKVRPSAGQAVARTQWLRQESIAVAGQKSSARLHVVVDINVANLYPLIAKNEL